MGFFLLFLPVCLSLLKWCIYFSFFHLFFFPRLYFVFLRLRLGFENEMGIELELENGLKWN